MTMEAPSTYRPVTFETAGEHVTKNVPMAEPSDRVEDIRRSLAGSRFDTVQAVAVCEDEQLVGLLRIEDLFAAPADAIAEELMDRDPPLVTHGTDQEVVAARAVRHGESTLAVVDEEARFLGLVPPVRLLSVLLWEHEEDMARLGGFLHDAATARQASEEPVAKRFIHRMPWLLVGLAGAILAAGMVDAFEDRLRTSVTLAFFVPGIVYMADAIGTQTETLVIRGLSVGVSIGRVVRRELVTGALVGTTLAIAFLPVAYVGWGEADVAVAAALALFAASATATLVAMGLPAVLHRLGRDPAYGSGPLATVIQDLLSILIYFLIAAALVS